MRAKILRQFNFLWASVGIVFSLMAFSSICEAYMEDYPPYLFKDGAPAHLKAEMILGQGQREYKSSDKQFTGKVQEESFETYDLILKDGKVTIVDIKKGDLPVPNVVYRGDVNGDGENDVIVLSSYRGNGLAANFDRVDIYLKGKKGKYHKVSYDTMSAGIEDFVDLNKDGNCEVIVTGFYGGKKHNYFTYSIYAIKGDSPVNADARFAGYPKFIQYTKKSNDKDTMHLTEKERKASVEKKNRDVRTQSENAFYE